MFDARLFILLIVFLKLVYDICIMSLSNSYRKKPLPAEVADIFDKDRYEKYISYVADKQKLFVVFTAINLIMDILLLFSPIYAGIERLCNCNVYMIFLVTYVIFWLFEFVLDYIRAYIMTFKIEEKYNLNKKTKAEFIKDIILDQILEIVLTIGLMCIVIFVGEHLSSWTDGFNVGLVKSILICTGIAVAIGVFIVAGTLLSYFILKKQYTFTPIQEGELKNKIVALMDGSKKKVKKIYVYNESKKSTRKNAFLLKIFWHKEFGIADNFITGNDERQLLAVLSHEVGHLKHKKNLLNYIGYLKWIAVFAIAIFLVYKPFPVLTLNEGIRNSFDITVNNYYMWFLVFSNIVEPIIALVGIFSTYVTRREEYEADGEAVKNGYAKELISTFKELSSDELINVNPHPLVEFLEYDHPGMYRRIAAINALDERLNKGGDKDE